MSPILGRERIIFPQTQNKILMERFQANKFPTKEEKRKLAMSFNTTEKKDYKLVHIHALQTRSKGKVESRLVFFSNAL